MPGFDFKNALDYTRWYAQIRQIKRKALSLFDQAIAAAREAGGPYLDIPDNLAQTWQDSAGTIPAAIGSTVGLLTDRSFGGEFGPELGNDPFCDNTAAWTFTQPTSGVAQVADGIATVQSNNGSLALASQALSAPLVVGRTYELVADITSTNGVGLRFDLGGITGTAVSATGIYRRVYYPTSATSAVDIVRGGFSSCGGTVTSLSVRELRGNHATQATAGNRFLLELYNGHPMLRGNGASTSAQFAVNPIGPTLSQPYTIIVGGVSGAWGSARCVYGDSARKMGVASGGAFFVEHTGGSGGAFITAASLPSGTAFVAEVVYDGTTITVRVNDASAGAAARGAPTTAAGAAFVGQRGNNTEFFNGLLLPVFATNSVVPEADRRAIARGMAQKLGVVYV